MRTLGTKTTVLSIAMLLISTTLSAGKRDWVLSVQIEGEDGGGLSLSLAAGFVTRLLESLAGTAVECDGPTDKDTRAMLEHLDRRGEGSRYRFRGDEGKRIEARRRRGQLEIDIARRGEKGTHLSLPWSLAECMLGRRIEVVRDAGAELVLEDDGAIRIRIE